MTADAISPTWNLVFASVSGTAHQGGVCQDHADGRVVAGPDGPVLIAAVADGAGSAAHSEVGARVAVEAFLTAAEAGDFATMTEDTLRAWIDSARVAVACAAEERGVPPRQMACTLLVAVVGSAWAWFAQIGDGLIVFDGLEPAGFAFAFWPDSGEYVNTTRFLTDADYPSRLRSDRLSRPVSRLALLTDGLQMLAVDYATAEVHGRFFAPLLAVVAAATDQDKVRSDLAGFLDSPRINARTDDDKTLFLATRRP